MKKPLLSKLGENWASRLTFVQLEACQWRLWVNHLCSDVLYLHFHIKIFSIDYTGNNAISVKTPPMLSENLFLQSCSAISNSTESESSPVKTTLNTLSVGRIATPEFASSTEVRVQYLFQVPSPLQNGKKSLIISSSFTMDISSLQEMIKTLRYSSPTSRLLRCCGRSQEVMVVCSHWPPWLMTLLTLMTSHWPARHWLEVLSAARKLSISFPSPFLSLTPSWKKLGKECSGCIILEIQTIS